MPIPRSCNISLAKEMLLHRSRPPHGRRDHPLRSIAMHSWAAFVLFFHSLTFSAHSVRALQVQTTCPIPPDVFCSMHDPPIGLFANPCDLTCTTFYNCGSSGSTSLEACLAGDRFDPQLGVRWSYERHVINKHSCSSRSSFLLSIHPSIHPIVFDVQHSSEGID